MSIHRCNIIRIWKSNFQFVQRFYAFIKYGYFNNNGTVHSIDVRHNQHNCSIQSTNQTVGMALINKLFFVVDAVFRLLDFFQQKEVFIQKAK